MEVVSKSNEQFSDQDSLKKKLARGASYCGLAALAIFSTSGVGSMEDQPVRPSEECWKDIADQLPTVGEAPALVPLDLMIAANDPPVLAAPDSGKVSSAFDISVPDFLKSAFSTEYIGNFKTIQTFELIGGVKVNVRRDQNLPIDGKALNEMFEKVLTADYPDMRMQAHMWCFYNSLVNGKYADMELNLRIPSNAEVCYSGVRLTTRYDCNSLGSTMPNPRWFGHDNPKTTYITATAGADPNGAIEDHSAKINRVLAHELAWHWQYSLEGDAFPFTYKGWNYDEQYAKDHLNPYLERIIAPDGKWPKIVPFS